MKILVDADACPVRDIIVKVAKEYNLEVLMFADTSHQLHDGYSTIITVSHGKDAVDIALINNVKEGDIVVTQDYGVASMALGKKAYAINHNGFVYDIKNIDRLLFERHLYQKIRRSGGRTPGPRKRNRESNSNFEKAFRILCHKPRSETMN